MKEQGFTLIELIAVVTILVAIFLVAFPSILNLSTSNDELDYNSMVDSLCLAGESYIYDNPDLFNESLSIVNFEINIPIYDLISNGYVDKNIINKKTKKLINTDTLIYTVLDDNSLDCKYKEE